MLFQRQALALSRGDPETALRYLDSALHWLRETQHNVPPFFSVCTLAFSVAEYDAITMPIFEETMLVGRRVGVAQAEAYVLGTVAFAARGAGRFSDAAQALDRALRLFQSLGDRAGEAFALGQLGHLHRVLGEIAAAISCACVSSAKWPVSSRRTTASGWSRRYASAPAGTKNGSFRPHTARSGGRWDRKYAWNCGYSATFVA